ncbi:hypothetical protein [Streptococcus loxodontisalivarius]|uniref:MFS family permease n=1 Tax=Streptococcus loxodontisalivarius TaxID=1349415 RepID=A0ABS2PRI3_9STRE|nr:hypothetical protein [Streptococcus loxodontisalivarius]MBM7642325.1 MFS family permease [Streptococcus loxodontisalivarius]
MTYKSLIKYQLVMKSVETYNIFLYQLQKIPFLGKLLPNRIYAINEFKGLAFIIQLLITIIISLIRSIAYVIFAYLTSSFLLSRLYETISINNKESSHFIGSLTIMVILSIFLYLPLNLKLINRLDMSLAMAIRVFRIRPKDYFKSFELLDDVKGLIFRIVVFGVFMIFNGYSIFNALAFILLLAGSRLFVKVATLPLYHTSHQIKESRLNYLSGISFFIGFVLSVCLIIAPSSWTLTFYSWQAGLLGIILWLVSFYLLSQNKELDQLTRALVTHESMREHENLLENATLKAVEVKEEEIDFSTKSSQQELRGIPYLNNLFMQRMGKRLRKGIAIRFIIFLLVWILLIISTYLINMGFLNNLNWKSVVDFNGFFFISVILGYFFYLGETYMKFCFYHLDRPLLKFSYYRKSEVVKESLKTRFRTSLILNTPLFLMSNLLYLTAYLVFFNWKIEQVLLLILGQLISMIFFSLYFLYLYFLLQPFTDGMSSKSFVYNTLTGVFYLTASWIFNLAPHITKFWMLTILLIMIVFLVSGYLAVLKLAPKTFKLK